MFTAETNFRPVMSHLRGSEIQPPYRVQSPGVEEHNVKATKRQQNAILSESQILEDTSTFFQAHILTRRPKRKANAGRCATNSRMILLQDRGKPVGLLSLHSSHLLQRWHQQEDRRPQATARGSANRFAKWLVSLSSALRQSPRGTALVLPNDFHFRRFL